MERFPRFYGKNRCIVQQKLMSHIRIVLIPDSIQERYLIVADALFETGSRMVIAASQRVEQGVTEYIAHLQINVLAVSAAVAQPDGVVDIFNRPLLALRIHGNDRLKLMSITRQYPCRLKHAVPAAGEEEGSRYGYP